MFKVRIEWTGPVEHQRFLLNLGDGHYWTGSRWSRDFKEARLYFTHQDCARVFNVIAERHFADKPLRQFEVTLQVKVFADQKYSLNDLKNYLSDAATLALRIERGYGPVDDSLVIIVIPWDSLCEVTPHSAADEILDQ